MSSSEEQYTWDLTLFFKGDDDPAIEKEKKEVEENSYKFINKWKERDDYLSDPSVLLEALIEYEKWAKHYGVNGKVAYYYSLRAELDQSNPDIKAKLNSIIDFGSKILNDIQFFRINLSKVNEAKQKEFLNYKGLEQYKTFLIGLFNEGKYLLSDSEEKIFNLLAKPAGYNWTQMTEGFLSKETKKVLTEDGKKEVKSFNEIANMIDTKNKEVRESSFKVVSQIRKKWSEVAENELNSILELKKVSDDLRGFDRPDKERHIADDIGTEVIDSLVESVSKRFDISQRFYTLKAKLLKKDKLKSYEANLSYEHLDPAFADKEMQKYKFEDGVALIKKVFKELDPEFAEILQKSFDERRIDVFPKKGKTGGAFCSHDRTIDPVYILLNYDEKLDDVLTLAHEAGHSINNELSRIQSELNFGSSTATAEVASTFMEDFVLQEVIKEADDETKFILMMKKLVDDMGTIMLQVGCYNFEWNLHKKFREKGYLSKEEIAKIFVKEMKKVFGKNVEFNSGKLRWVNWSHIRRFFYVYSYASGLLISKSLQNSVKQDKKFIVNVKKFLASGTSKSPKDIFMEMGIDISDKNFWNKGLDEIESLLNETEKLAVKLGKL